MKKSQEDKLIIHDLLQAGAPYTEVIKFFPGQKEKKKEDKNPKPTINKETSWQY